MQNLGDREKVKNKYNYLKVIIKRENFNQKN